MKNSELIHVLRAATQIWKDAGIPDRSPIAIIGSQSILFYHSDSHLPDAMTYSHEADIFLIDYPDIGTSDIVSGAIGEGTNFHQTHGIYADGIDIRTVKLPIRWLDRAKTFTVDLQDNNNSTALVAAIAPEDLIAAKLYANRPKDREYIAAAKEAELIDTRKLLKSIYDMPVDNEMFHTLTVRYDSIKPVVSEKTKVEPHSASWSELEAKHKQQLDPELAKFQNVGEARAKSKLGQNKNPNAAKPKEDEASFGD